VAVAHSRRHSIRWRPAPEAGPGRCEMRQARAKPLRATCGGGSGRIAKRKPANLLRSLVVIGISEVTEDHRPTNAAGTVRTRFHLIGRFPCGPAESDRSGTLLVRTALRSHHPGPAIKGQVDPALGVIRPAEASFASGLGQARGGLAPASSRDRPKSCWSRGFRLAPTTCRAARPGERVWRRQPISPSRIRCRNGCR